MNLRKTSPESLAKQIADAYPNAAVDYALGVVRHLTRLIENDFATSMLAVTSREHLRRRRSKADVVVDTVCAYYGVSESDLLSSSRNRCWVRPRWMVCWVLHHRLKMSSTMIGRRLSKDRTTVFNALAAFDPVTGANACALHEYDGFDPAQDWAEVNLRLDTVFGVSSAVEAAE